MAAYQTERIRAVKEKIREAERDLAAADDEGRKILYLRLLVTLREHETTLVRAHEAGNLPACIAGLLAYWFTSEHSSWRSFTV